jgi:hypothetical protein
MMNGIQAIETFYRGIRFRSRLEARWAKLFSELGIDWMYETEGYNIALKDGTHIRYLPDFVLRGGSIRCPDPLFVEVKGDMKAEDAIKIRAFSDYHPIYVVGAIPEDITDIENGIDTDYRVPYYNFETVDGDYFGAVLGVAKGSGWGLFGADSNYWREMDETKTRQAYALARMARFE